MSPIGLGERLIDLSKHVTNYVPELDRSVIDGLHVRTSFVPARSPCEGRSNSHRERRLGLSDSTRLV